MKVEFNRLRVKNALSFVSADLPLKDQGLVLIRGENLDDGGSNGAGKTALFELFYNLITDKVTKTDRKIKKSSLLNAHHPKDFLVRLDMTSNGDDYQIDKFRSHSKRGTGLSILRGGTDVTPNDPREAQKYISGLVGMTPNEILGRVYLSQRHTHMMIDGTPAQKKEYLSRCFGWDTLDVMVKETTKRLNGIPLPDETHLKSLLEGVESDLAVLGDAETIRTELSVAQDKQAKLQLALVDMRVALSQQEAARASSEARQAWKTKLSALQLDLELASLKTSIQKRRKAVASSREALIAARRRQMLEARLAAEGELPDLEGDADLRLEAIAKKLSRFERDLPGAERREKLERQLAPLPHVEETLELLTSRSGKWQEKLALAQSRLTAVKAEIAKLHNVGDVCYTCLRPIQAYEKGEMLREREEAFAGLRSAVEKAKESLSYYAENLAALQKRMDLVSQIEGLPAASAADLQTSIDSLRKEQSTIQKLSQQLARAQSIREQLSELPVNESSLEDLESVLASAESKLDICEEAYQWLLANGDVQWDPHTLQRTQGAVNAYESQLEELNALLLRCQEKLTRLQALEKQKKDITKTLNAASDEKSRHRVLRYLTVSLAELKKLSLRESTELLSGVLPLYLNQLFPNGGIKLGVTDDADGFDLMFLKGGQPIPLTMISGGQAKRVGIAILFAFAKMGRNTTNLLICDEPFRDLDQNGREACFELLRDFGMGTVLVTSHDQDMNAPRKYDQVWTVRMLNHTSRLYLDG